jgi:multidrug efflux system membrane fusion protein
MNTYSHRLLLLTCTVSLTAALAGCGNRAASVAPAEPLVVPFSYPVPRKVQDYLEFTGRTDAVEAVDVRARVTGYLVNMPFQEGADVQAGDLLFEVDPRPYRAQLDQARSQIALYKAQLALAQSTYERDRKAGIVAVPLQQLDQDLAAIEEARAQIEAAKASTEVYQLNYDFTRVTSQIAGKVSRYYLTAGNLVIQDQTLLTTVVSLNPIYAYFDMDEPNLLKIRRAINQGRIKLPEPGTKVPLELGLQGEKGFPHMGSVNFINNQVNPATGSISIRGIFPNPKPGEEALPEIGASTVGFLTSPTGAGPLLAASALFPGRTPDGTRLLSPGMFVRIRLPIGQRHDALLVIDRAIGSDQGIKFLYVLDKDNKVQQRRISTGALQEDGRRVIEPYEGEKEGIKATDRIVVGALLQIRPRMVVQAEEIPMPTLEGAEQDKEIRRQGDKETRK